jgi:hypothetical protein
MIAITDKSLVIFLQHRGYKIIDYCSLGRFYGKDTMAYVFNDVNHIRAVKEAYETGALDIHNRAIYYKLIGGQQKTLDEMENESTL